MIALGMAATFVAYLALASTMLQGGDLPSNHKWFLLKEAPDQVLVIDGGSSAHFGVDPVVLGEALGRPAINIADQAGYHFADRARRLDRYLDEGDAVLLTLEWVNAFRERPTDVYIEHLTLYNSDYVRSLPPWERSQRMLQISPDAILERRLEQPENALSDDAAKFKNIRDRLNRDDMRHGGQAVERGVRDEARRASKSCDAFLVEGAEVGDVVSESFRRGLSTFRDMQARGVAVAFTWAPAVGDACYATDALRGAEAAIRSAMREYGIPIIGSPSGFKYSDQYIMDDSYYHLNTQGRALHSQKLAEALRGMEGFAGRRARIGVGEQTNHYYGRIADRCQPDLFGEPLLA